jgi:hypothetical protein
MLDNPSGADGALVVPRVLHPLGAFVTFQVVEQRCSTTMAYHKR